MVLRTSVVGVGQYDRKFKWIDGARTKWVSPPCFPAQPPSPPPRVPHLLFARQASKLELHVACILWLLFSIVPLNLQGKIIV